MKCAKPGFAHDDLLFHFENCLGCLYWNSRKINARVFEDSVIQPRKKLAGNVWIANNNVGGNLVIPLCKI